MTEAEVIAIFEDLGLDPTIHFDGTEELGRAARIAASGISEKDLRATLTNAPPVTQALARNALLVRVGNTYRVTWELGDNLGSSWYTISGDQLKNIYGSTTPTANVTLNNLGQFEDRFGDNYWGNVAEIDLKAEDPWQDLKSRIFANFGYVPGFDEPEIRRLLIQGYFENWNQNQFTVAYSNTGYYNDLTNIQRAWFGISEAEKTRRISQQAAQLTQEYFNLYGRSIGADDPGIRDAALNIVSGQMTVDQWRYEARVGAETEPETPASRRVREEGEAQLAEGNQVENLTNFAEAQWREWVGPVAMPTSFASRWGTQLASGQASEADLQSYLKEVSGGRWSFKPPNLTWADWSSTYKSQIRNTLELGSLDDSDPLLTKVLGSDLTGVDLEQMIRADNRFKSTNTMFGELSSLADSLGRSFGFIT